MRLTGRHRKETSIPNRQDRVQCLLSVPGYARTAEFFNKIFRMKHITVLMIMGIVLGSPMLYSQSSFPGTRLETAVKDYVYGKTGQDANVELMGKVMDYTFNESGVRASVSSSNSPLRGLCSVAINFSHDGHIIRSISVPLRIYIYETVAVANRPLRSGDVISESDISYKKMEVSRIPESEIPSTEELIGAKLKKSIYKDALISRSALEEEMIISRGDQITVIVTSGAVKIRTTAYAMQDASAGETVKFKHNENVLQGKVAMDGSVVMNSSSFR